MVTSVTATSVTATSGISGVTAASTSVVTLQQEHQAQHTPEHPAFVDLQVHTTASDGALAPAVVVQAASMRNWPPLPSPIMTPSRLDEAIEAGASPVCASCPVSS